MSEVYQAVPPQLKSIVINAVLQLITAKAIVNDVKEQESARRLMTDVWNIQKFLANQGHEVPHSHIEDAVSVLVASGGPLRYYEREYNGKTYRSYGLTKKFWADFDTQVAQRAGATA